VYTKSFRNKRSVQEMEEGVNSPLSRDGSPGVYNHDGSTEDQTDGNMGVGPPQKMASDPRSADAWKRPNSGNGNHFAERKEDPWESKNGGKSGPPPASKKQSVEEPVVQKVTHAGSSTATNGSNDKQETLKNETTTRKGDSGREKRDSQSKPQNYKEAEVSKSENSSKFQMPKFRRK